MAPQEWRLLGTRPTATTHGGSHWGHTKYTREDPQVPACSIAETRECFACSGTPGIVYIGYLVPTPDGTEEEVYEPRCCGLCGGTGLLAEDL